MTHMQEQWPYQGRRAVGGARFAVFARAGAPGQTAPECLCVEHDPLFHLAVQRLNRLDGMSERGFHGSR